MAEHYDQTSGDFHKLAELIADIRVAMMTTFSGTHEAHTRPMYTQQVDAKSFDGKLWFMTDVKSKKTDELSSDSHILVTYSAPDKNRYVAVYGSGRVERNIEKQKELFGVHAKGWWPGGPEDANLRLIEVTVESAEYWDGPSNTSYMLKLLKAVVTGTRIQTAGEHGEVKA